MSDIFRDMSFGGMLREARIKNNMTMRQACKISGIDVGNYSKLEASRFPPPNTKYKIVELCKKMKIECSDFMIQQAYAFHLGALHEKFWGEQ